MAQDWEQGVRQAFAYGEEDRLRGMGRGCKKTYGDGVHRRSVRTVIVVILRARH
jgi:hypothetical protein